MALHDEDDEALEIAARHLVRELRELEGDTSDPRRKLASSIAAEALLAIRDTVKRGDHPQVFDGRMSRIRELLKS